MALPFAQDPKPVQAARWLLIVGLALAPFGIRALGADLEAVALAAVLCAAALTLVSLYFFFADPPSEGAPEYSLNPHPRHGVLAWVPSTSRRLVQSILVYGAMTTGSLLLLWAVPPDWSGLGDASDGVFVRGMAALLLVVSATGAPLELLGAFFVRRWGRNPPPKALVLGLLGGGALAWLSGSWVRLVLSPPIATAVGPGHLPGYLFDWLPELLVLGYVVATWHRHGQVNVWQARVEAAETGRRLAEAQLAMLQAQVEPHFLYNTLASVQYLVRKDSAAADFLLTQLIRYLRSAMPKLRASLSTLGQEFELADAYLQIARMRMGGRLAVSVELAEALHALPFPPLVLQTLVENALKHGVEPKVGPVQIVVRAERQGDALTVVVEDNGVGLVAGPGPSPTAGSGTGLANIRQRLRGLYDGRAQLTVAQRAEGGVRSTVSIPAEPVAEDA